MLPDCRESLAARQEGTNSVQGVPAAAPLTHQQSKGSALRPNVYVFISVPVCVCFFFYCVDVFVLVRDTDPACPLLCPAICHCCTLGSVRMVWAPAVPPVTPQP